MDTNQHYSPWDQLPALEPKTVSPPLGEFYDNTAKHLIKDTVRIMNNGLSIDMDRVFELEETLNEQLLDVKARLAANPLISEFQKLQHHRLTKDFIAERKTKLRDSSYYLKPFDYSNMVHRSYFMHLYATQQGIPLPAEEVSPGISKWPANLVKTFAKTRPFLQQFLLGKLTKHTLFDEATQLIADHKSAMYNEKFLSQIKSPDLEMPEFNPASSKQKQELFAWLNVESEKTSKDTGLPSFDRDEIERIHKETLDDNIKDFTQSFIDHSFAAIVRNNFIEAFYRYSIDNRLYGTLKLLGAKSARYTSQNPNLLNMPSTKSIFAKPIKRCFKAPEGKIILTADYSALEDRVIASLTRDTNKCNVFLEGLDGHCLNAYGYFPEEIAALMPITGNTVTDVKEFDKLRADLPALDAIRQKGKPATFGLSYGAYPPKVSRSLKISLPAAEAIFNNYHNVLYPDITNYRENYVLPTVQEHGRIHLGLGFYLKSDDPNRDIRTLANATVQFWSILTAIAINKMHQYIDDAGLQDSVKIVSTIYDSIYFEIDKDPEIIKWVNDRLIPVMSKDFMPDQTVHNDAESEIGPDWATLKAIPANATTTQINEVLKDLYDT